MMRRRKKGLRMVGGEGVRLRRGPVVGGVGLGQNVAWDGCDWRRRRRQQQAVAESVS